MFSKILVLLVLVAIVIGKRLTPQERSLENLKFFTEECKGKFSDEKELADCIKPYEVDYHRRVHIFNKQDTCLAECPKTAKSLNELQKCKGMCSYKTEICFDDVPRVKDECVEDMKDPVK